MAELYFQNGELLFVSGELGMHADCCCDDSCEIEWTEFTDEGFIDGGQDGALRTYASPGSVSNSPWTLQAGTSGLRLAFEDSDDVPPGHPEVEPTTGAGCTEHNPYTQTASATGSFTLPSDGFIRIDWEGMGEQQDPGFEEMVVTIDGVVVATAHAPGGNLGCAAMAAVVSSPESPVYIALAAGAHSIFVAGSTNDRFYHVDAYYQFIITCGVPGQECCDDEGGRPTASFTITENSECNWTFTSTSTDGPCGTIDSYHWSYRVTGGSWIFGGVGGTGSSFTLDLDACDLERLPFCECDERTVEVKLTVTDDNGCASTFIDSVTCGSDITETATVGPPGASDCDPDPEPGSCIDCDITAPITWPEFDSGGNKLCVAYIACAEEPCSVLDIDADCNSVFWPGDGWTTSCGTSIGGGIMSAQVLARGHAWSGDENSNLCVWSFLYRQSNPCCQGPLACDNWEATDPPCTPLACCGDE